MVKKRDAVDTITGYYYQFDYYILQLLEAKEEVYAVTLEGIEDVDILSKNKVMTVQCKYQAKTSYNHSVIAKPIRLMLKDYATRTREKPMIRYKLYGHYEKGQDKYPGKLTIEFAKKNLFSYVQNGKKHELHLELGLSDLEIKEFLSRVDVDVYAVSFEKMEEKVIRKIAELFQCDLFESEYYFYNNALRVVKNVATRQDITDRTISKKCFLDMINKKRMLFDTWYLELKGTQEYSRAIKKRYFTKNNVSPHERFFLVQCDNLVKDVELKALLLKISNNWSRLSQREKSPFCPYFYFEGLSDERLLNIKNLLHNENVNINDGHSYLGADFSAADITKQANCYNGIKAKIINKLDYLQEIFEITNGIIEIYVFYLVTPFYESAKRNCFEIQIPSTNCINMMI